MAFPGYMTGHGMRGRGRMGLGGLSRTVRSDNNMFAVLANQDGGDGDTEKSSFLLSRKNK